MKKLILTADPAKLVELNSFMEQELEAAGFLPPQQNRILIAVEEVFVNIASYAYAELAPRSCVAIEFSSNNTSGKIVFYDSGRPYNPLLRPDPDISLPAQERDAGGLGIFMTKKFADSITYNYSNEQNILCLEFAKHS